MDETTEEDCLSSINSRFRKNAFKVAEDAAVPYATRKKIASLLNEAMARRGGEL